MNYRQERKVDNYHALTSTYKYSHMTVDDELLSCEKGLEDDEWSYCRHRKETKIPACSSLEWRGSANFRMKTVKCEGEMRKLAFQFFPLQICLYGLEG